jgi:thiamine pyrophosphokinase
MANIQLLGFLLDNGATGELIGPGNTVCLLQNESRQFEQKSNETLSVFAWEKDAKGVTLQGVQYPLKKAVLTTRFPLGAGNHILKSQATVTVEDGALLVVCSEF